MAQFIPFSNLIFPVISLLFNSSPLQSTQDKVLHRIFYIHIKVEYTAAQLIHRSPPFQQHRIVRAILHHLAKFPV